MVKKHAQEESFGDEEDDYGPEGIFGRDSGDDFSAPELDEFGLEDDGDSDAPETLKKSEAK